MVKRVVKEEDIAWALYSLGYLYSDRKHLNEAEKMYKRALQGYVKALGLKYILTLDTVNNLAYLYAD
jgi:Tetratricopeptide repeat